MYIIALNSFNAALRVIPLQYISDKLQAKGEKKSVALLESLIVL